MKIGDLTSTGLREWPVSISEAMERVQKEWDTVDLVGIC